MRRKLTEADTYYIEHHRTESAENLSATLNLKVDVIQGYIDELSKKPRFENLLAQRDGATVMTPAASELSDDNLRKGKKHTQKSGVIKMSEADAV